MRFVSISRSSYAFEHLADDLRSPREGARRPFGLRLAVQGLAVVFQRFLLVEKYSFRVLERVTPRAVLRDLFVELPALLVTQLFPNDHALRLVDEGQPGLLVLDELEQRGLHLRHAGDLVQH